ncbi:LAFE_0B03422g1_1 [Lachancea fermentati]|uniref:Protein transport protein SEC31 n=1 Tax=Lachancea fermentati TaxID=4955 RepID=A0A1G4M7V9_LACFM|nr:LAFE_0B03422g1_1 [Lachancea fermentati]
MVKLAEYPRTATFAWSHEKVPLLATGTAAGTIDADFSSDSKLELWSLLSPNPTEPLGTITADAKFNDLDWSYDNNILAGALDNGAVEFFSPKDYNSVAKITKHTMPVNTLRFNAKQANVLCSGGSNGELYIWDTNKITTPGYVPFVPGTAMTPIDDIYSLAWNQNQSHVFASAGASGFASIWDLKAKKEVIHLSYTSPVTGLKNQLSVVEWHPNNSTKIATGSGFDNDPVILIWDLRNANAPQQVLSNGHTKGILSLDWCRQDEKLMLSSGRDNTCMLWNPEQGQNLIQFPTRGNWCFKTKFAPEAPDLFASASFDNKIEIQTLQNLTTNLDLEEDVHKQRESETEFWTHVSEKDSNEKPIVNKLQAPSWYGNKSPAAQWAFGGKLVSITGGGKDVTISKPSIPGIEKNFMLDDALKSKDFKPIINKRLAQSIDDVNEDDWNLLEKLSMDGKQAFLEEAFALDDEETEKKNDDDGDDFFSSLNEKCVPEGPFRLETDEKSVAMMKSLFERDFKSSVTSCLEQDLLLESLVIALDSDDDTLKQKVKNAYFSKYVKGSSLARVLYSFSERNVEDLVKNLEVDQWKFTAKAIFTYTSDLSKRNELLVELGDKVLASDNRQDALVLYLAAHSLDKVASIWLKDFMSLESKLKSKKETVYEAHLECLTEFVEKFTVFSSYANDGGDYSLTNEELISKFLEFVNLTSASGDFDLALEFLDTLPSGNEDVATEKQRVLIASNKLPSSTSKSKNARYATATANLSTPGATSVPTMPPTGILPPQGPAVSTYSPASPFSQPAALNSRNASFAATTSSSIKQNPYAPPASQISSIPSKYAPAANLSQAPAPSFAPPANNMPANPYAPASTRASAAPVNSSYVAPPPQTFGASPIPVASVIPATAAHLNDPDAFLPPISPSTSGQTPHLNRKANDGWNDLPLDVKEKPTRAKAVSVAPVSVNVSPNLASTANLPPNSTSLPPPPLSRVTSGANIATPLPRKVSAKSFTPPASITSPPQLNPYAPPTNSAAAPAPMPTNPYAPPTQNPYAASQPVSVPPPVTTPYGIASPANGTGYIAPPKPVVGPPPKTMNRKSHASHEVNSANTLLESVQHISEAPTPQPVPAASTSNLTSSSSVPPAAVGIPESQQPIVDFLSSELARVAPLIPQEYTKQLKDCKKRLNILFTHLETQDLLTQPTVDKLHEIVSLMKEHRYEEAMKVHVDIATNHAQEAGNWLTGVKRLIGIAEVTSN